MDVVLKVVLNLCLFALAMFAMHRALRVLRAPIRQRVADAVANPPQRFEWTRTKVTLAIGVAVFLMWNGGFLDHTLKNVGLSRHACYQNAFGATFCGDEAKRYCDRIRDAFGSSHSGDCAYIR